MTACADSARSDSIHVGEFRELDCDVVEDVSALVARQQDQSASISAQSSTSKFTPGSTVTNRTRCGDGSRHSAARHWNGQNHDRRTNAMIEATWVPIAFPA